MKKLSGVILYDVATIIYIAFWVCHSSLFFTQKKKGVRLISLLSERSRIRKKIQEVIFFIHKKNVNKHNKAIIPNHNPQIYVFPLVM